MMRKWCVLAMLVLCAQAHAGLLDAISGKDATSGLKQALEQGATRAVATLGVADGFQGNPRFRIPLPDAIRQIEPALRLMGRGQAIDDLQLAMNRAAESAVAEAKPLLVTAVKQMTVQDAKSILSGGDDSVTQYFRGKTSAALQKKFQPLVQQATRKQQLAEQYDRLAGQGAALGLIKPEDARVDSFVTSRALDALYLRIAEEEREIRQNPAGAVGSLAKRVFGAL